MRLMMIGVATFGYESVSLVGDGRVLDVLTSVVAGLGAAAGGYALGSSGR